MANLIQLDAAAKLAGKSEVTIRRLIKSGRLPAEKQKTLTGFIYLVDADKVQAYYKTKPAESSPAHSEQEEEAVHAVTSHGRTRVAVSDTHGNTSGYWAARAEAYEERYHKEVEKNGELREELGLWRGRAEHAQGLLVKLLPAPNTVEVKEEKVSEPKKRSSRRLSFAGMVVVIALPLLVLIGGALLYLILNPRV